MQLCDEDLELLNQRDIRLIDGLVLKCERCKRMWVIQARATESTIGKGYRVKTFMREGLGSWFECPRCTLESTLEMRETELRKNGNPTRVSDVPQRTDIATVR